MSAESAGRMYEKRMIVDGLRRIVDVQMMLSGPNCGREGCWCGMYAWVKYSNECREWETG